MKIPQDAYSQRWKSIHSDLTRWKPRLVECIEDKDATDGNRIECVVKFRRGSNIDSSLIKRASAMSISELVVAMLLQKMNVRTPEPLFVYVSEDFARSYDSMNLGYEVLEGYHFATVFIEESMHTVPLPMQEHLINPYDIVRLWAIDNWLCNIDRTVYGNILYLPVGNKWQVVAVDNSDCFCGSSSLADGESLANPDKNLTLGSLQCFLSLMATEKGVHMLRQTTNEFSRIASSVRSVTCLVPDQWWYEAGVDRGQLENYVEHRAGIIETICEVQQWEKDYNASRGGYILDL